MTVLWRKTLLLIVALACASGAGAQAVPITRIAEVAFEVSNLKSARGYYEGVLGFPEAFQIKSLGGAAEVFFKVNDNQYIIATPTLKPGELDRNDHVALQTSDIQAARRALVAQGLNPSAITQRADGNPVFSLRDPEGNQVQFIQYVPGSRQEQLRSKLDDSPRVSKEIYHAGLWETNRQAATDFYTKLGLLRGRTLPGASGEYLELGAHAIDLETKNPPIPDTPATHARYMREQYGSMYHVCVAVPDIQAAKRFVESRGHLSDAQVAVHIGHNRHWMMNTFDPDGSRTEIMEPFIAKEAASPPAGNR